MNKESYVLNLKKQGFKNKVKILENKDKSELNDLMINSLNKKIYDIDKEMGNTEITRGV